MNVNTTDTVNITLPLPKKWFSILDIKTLALIDQSPWPWTHMTYNQWREIYDTIQPTSSTVGPEIPEIIVTVIISVIGLFSSLFILNTVYSSWRSGSKVTIFTASITISAILDFLYAFFMATRHLMIITNPPGFKVYFSFTAGLGYMTSLASDMLTLCLTIDRYVALAYPMFYKIQKTRIRRWAWAVMLTISFFISSTRLHYCFGNYYYKYPNIENSEEYNAIKYFSDLVVPFILCGIIIPLAIATCVKIFKRYRQKTEVGATSDAGHESDKKAMHNNISLLLVLLAMFFLNQLGYMLMSLVELMSKYQPTLSFDSEFWVIKYIFYVNKLSNPMAVTSDIVENFSRCFVFFAYISFNRIFYRNFVKGVRQISSHRSRMMSVSTIDTTSKSGV